MLYETDMTIEAIEFQSAPEAIQYANASDREAILLDRKPLVVAQREADRLAEAGVEFAYLCDHEMPDGASCIMTVPVN
jgi:hypothetical protein